MTTPKAKKFRIRRHVAPGTRKAEAAPVEDGFDAAPFPGSAAAAKAVTEPAATRGATDPDAIRAEGLTGRQFRLARRLAEKHGIAAPTDVDAVRELRLRGIDPFERASVLELVVPENVAEEGEGAAERVQLPQTVSDSSVPTRPAPHPPAPHGGLSEVREIQLDIARRQRRRLALLFGRLAVFVGLPTALAGYYYFEVATPMYATKSEFVIQSAEASNAGMGGLFSGTGFATSQDSITVQSYLTSRDAMLRLDRDGAFKAHFSQPGIDPIQRLPEGASNEAAYDLYQDNVIIGYDPTEGIIRMEVIAADPETSADYSRRLIDYAEERVDDMTQRLREDQMSGARDSYEEAEAKMMAAQARVLELQEQLGVLDPAAESGSIMSQITSFETQLRQKQLELSAFLANRRPNEARTKAIRGEIARLQGTISELRARMTEGSSDVASLARVSAQLRVAETDLQTRTVLMQQSLEQLEAARIEANRQSRYLSLGVAPIPPDEATYPRAFENTLLAFLVFSGIYLVVSLTASILREQVSA